MARELSADDIDDLQPDLDHLQSGSSHPRARRSYTPDVNIFMSHVRAANLNSAGSSLDTDDASDGFGTILGNVERYIMAREYSIKQLRAGMERSTRLCAVVVAENEELRHRVELLRAMAEYVGQIVRAVRICIILYRNSIRRHKMTMDRLIACLQRERRKLDKSGPQ